jgi:hypothetical protein
MRPALTLLLVLTACSAAPSDPVALLKSWRTSDYGSVRFDVRIAVEGDDPSSRTYAGVLHVANGGAVEQEDVTAHSVSRSGTTDYRWVTAGRDRCLKHSDLTLPPGKEYSGMGLNDAPWVGSYTRDLRMAAKDYHPSGLFDEIDRDTLRLVEHEDDRYVFSAGGVL